MRRLLFILLIALLLGLFFFFTQGLKQDPRILPSTLIQKPAPSFILHERNTNQPFTEKVFLGHTTLLNVWASWCEACAEEQAYLQALKKRRPELQIIGLDYKDNFTEATQWLKKYGNPYQWILMDQTGQTAIDYGVYGTPESFLIGPDGIIMAKHVGVLTKDNQLFKATMFIP